MTQTTTTPQAELDYLKSLADAGRKTPLVGGSYGVMWGALYTPPPLLLYAAAKGAIGLPGWVLPLLFLIPLPFGMIGNLVLGRRVSRTPGAKSFANKAAGAVWGAAGFAIFIVFAGAFATEFFIDTSANPAAHWGAGMAVLFAVYGVAYAATAFVSGFKAQAVFGVLSFIASAAMLAFMGRIEQLLIFGLALPVVSVLPGLVMMAQAPKPDSPADNRSQTPASQTGQTA